jgi:ribosomal protein L39E
VEENENTTVMISREASITLCKLAKANKRNKKGQLEWMIEMAARRLDTSGMETSTRVKSPSETTARGDAAKKKLRIARAKKQEGEEA